MNMHGIIIIVTGRAHISRLTSISALHCMFLFTLKKKKKSLINMFPVKFDRFDYSEYNLQIFIS